MGAESFLNLLYHDKPDKEFLLIWEKQRKDKKISFWFDRVSDAIQHCIANGSKCDTYVGCGTSAKALPEFRRCKAEEISGIPAAWIDVDILDPVHSKLNLPENSQKALEIIEPFPLKPTIVVHSGHGYQFWWVFDQFGKISTSHQREEAADMLHQFTWTMRDCARSMGYDLDMTFDLSRVFRIPGGKNYKDNPPLNVVMEQCNQHLLYKKTDFRDAIAEFRIKLGTDATPIGERKKTSITSGEVIQGEHFKMDPNAEPPKEKHETLMEFEPKYAASFQHKRKDFKSGDESASTYDLSLASFATAAGWDAQEIVNMLITFRRINGLPAKLVDSYYRRTLKAASNALENQKAFEDLEVIVNDREINAFDPNKTPEENAKKKNEIITAAKKILTDILKINIKKVVKYMVDPPEYRLETEKSCIHLGGIQNLIDQTYFKRKLADATGVYMPAIEGKKWRHVAQALLDLCEEVSAGEDTSNRGQVRHWFRNFLGHFMPLYDMTEGMISHRPFYYRDSLYFYGPDLRNYIATYWKELVNPKTMGIMLKEYGFQSTSLNVKNEGGKYVNRSAWRIEISKDKIAQEFVDMDLLNYANQIALEAAKEKCMESSTTIPVQ